MVVIIFSKSPKLNPGNNILVLFSLMYNNSFKIGTRHKSQSATVIYLTQFLFQNSGFKVLFISNNFETLQPKFERLSFPCKRTKFLTKAFSEDACRHRVITWRYSWTFGEVSNPYSTLATFSWDQIIFFNIREKGVIQSFFALFIVVLPIKMAKFSLFLLQKVQLFSRSPFVVFFLIRKKLFL